MNVADLANSVDSDEVAHYYYVAQNELPQLDLHCLPSCVWILKLI